MTREEVFTALHDVLSKTGLEFKERHDLLVKFMSLIYKD